MNEKEKAVLYVLSDNPGLLEKVSVNPKIFKGQGRDIFDELQRQFRESQSFSEEIAADKLKLKISQFHELFDGCYRFDESKLEFMLKEIEGESLSKEILLLVEKEMRSELKTGLLDKKKNAEIERMFKKRADLNDGSCLSSDFNSITKKGIDWLWSGRIPLGILTLIAGHPGTGKSFFSTWLAAKLSRGDALPGSKQKMEPCSTLLIAAEDDPASVIKPRLEANGADMSKIIFFKEPLKFSLDSIGILERELDKNPDIRNINIDPLTVFLGTKTDYFRDPDVRLKLVPLQDLAKKRRISIQAVVHLNKKEDADLITRIGGSMAFAGVARSVLGVSYDNRESDEDTRDSRLLSSLKLNLARRPDTLAFKINDNLRIDFNEKPVPIDADTLFSRESRERKQKQSMTDIWLLNYLSEHPDLMSREIVKAAREEEIPPASIHRSKRKLENQGLLISIESGFGKEHKSYWKLK
ncbi:hypothetical protein ES703_114519 [subsurface metagenome]